MIGISADVCARLVCVRTSVVSLLRNESPLHNPIRGIQRGHHKYMYMFFVLATSSFLLCGSTLHEDANKNVLHKLSRQSKSCVLCVTMGLN